MAWKDSLRKASFRGISFFVRTSEREGGRRVVDYEYPERDDPASEDIGRKKRGFSLEGYVLGENYFDDRNALISACEDEKGPGELIHPFYGSLDVVCKDIRVRESMVEEGRMATFSLTFSEAGLVADPSSTVDAKSSILAAASDAKAKSQSKFAKAFSIANQPGYVLDKAQSKINKAASALENSPVKGAAQGIADFGYKIRNLKASATALMQKPDQLASYLGDSTSGLQDVSGTKAESYKSFAVLAAFGASDNVTYSDTETGEVEKANDTAMNSFMQEQGIINAVETVIENSFDSFQDADKEKNFIIDNLDRMLESNTDDDVFVSMGNLRAIFISNFPLAGEDLPNIVKIQTTETIPSLVLAFQYYGDARREGEIVKRNKITNPAFIPGGMELEVING
jgi:prophage DNA circulation protein